MKINLKTENKIAKYTKNTIMTNKLSFFLMFTVLGLGTLLAQEKFIEVMVKDTVSLKPILYEFQVSSGLKFEYDYENPNAKNEFSKKLRQSEEKIVSLLKKWNYRFQLSQNPDINYTMEPTDKRNYIVRVNSLIQKEEFKTRMKQQGVNFYITDVKYESKETKIKEIYSRLLKKARKRAELIAQLANKEIGEIIEISESKSEFSIISSFIENFAYSRSNGSSSTSFQFNAGALEKSILVKFALK